MTGVHGSPCHIDYATLPLIHA
ncbi:protein of unknown function [Thauera humireducens]|nr:protein of unknown function [Thauera humireducens]